jgi:hypothetical protein
MGSLSEVTESRAAIGHHRMHNVTAQSVSTPEFPSRFEQLSKYKSILVWTSGIQLGVAYPWDTPRHLGGTLKKIVRDKH